MPQAQEYGEKPETARKPNRDLLFAFGSNLASGTGSPSEILSAALNALSKNGAVIRCISPFYSTPAYPAGNGPDFVNAAARISASWSAQEALEICHGIEAAEGRLREERWGQRTLDIDLIGMGDAVLPDRATHDRWRLLPPDAQMIEAPDQLILPHPRLQDRAFVLVPLADVAPDWIHPTLGKTVVEMRDALGTEALKEVKALQ